MVLDRLNSSRQDGYGRDWATVRGEEVVLLVGEVQGEAGLGGAVRWVVIRVLKGAT